MLLSFGGLVLGHGSTNCTCPNLALPEAGLQSVLPDISLSALPGKESPDLELSIPEVRLDVGADERTDVLPGSIACVDGGADEV